MARQGNYSKVQYSTVLYCTVQQGSETLVQLEYCTVNYKYSWSQPKHAQGNGWLKELEKQGGREGEGT